MSLTGPVLGSAGWVAKCGLLRMLSQKVPGWVLGVVGSELWHRRSRIKMKQEALLCGY
jgi:hypothetical protein